MGPTTRPPRRRRSSTSGLANAYRLRLADAIETAYPKLAAALGLEPFEAVIAEYLARFPSTRLSTPGGAGDRLPELLADARFPRWYAELAQLDRAYAEVVQAAVVVPATRDLLLRPGATVRLVPAHALLEVTTSCSPEPRAPHAILVWRYYGPRFAQGSSQFTSIVHRPIDDADEAEALRLAAIGARLVDLTATFATCPNPYARAVDLVFRWIEDGIVEAS